MEIRALICTQGNLTCRITRLSNRELDSLVWSYKIHQVQARRKSKNLNELSAIFKDGTIELDLAFLICKPFPYSPFVARNTYWECQCTNIATEQDWAIIFIFSLMQMWLDSWHCPCRKPMALQQSVKPIVFALSPPPTPRLFYLP